MFSSSYEPLSLLLHVCLQHECRKEEISQASVVIALQMLVFLQVIVCGSTIMKGKHSLKHYTEPHGCLQIVACVLFSLAPRQFAISVSLLVLVPFTIVIWRQAFLVYFCPHLCW